VDSGSQKRKRSGEGKKKSVKVFRSHAGDIDRTCLTGSTGDTRENFGPDSDESIEGPTAAELISHNRTGRCHNKERRKKVERGGGSCYGQGKVWKVLGKASRANIRFGEDL